MYISILLFLALVICVFFPKKDIYYTFFTIGLLFSLTFTISISYSLIAMLNPSEYKYYVVDNIDYSIGDNILIDFDELVKNIKEKNIVMIPYKEVMENDEIKFNKKYVRTENINFRKGVKNRLVVESYKLTSVTKFFLFDFNPKSYVIEYKDLNIN